MRVRKIEDVPATQLCSGCGACASVAPGEIRMVDDYELGRRPVFPAAGATREASRRALACCPGIGLRHPPSPPDGALPDLWPGWGPVLEVREGYAADASVRHAGSSGGAASALALHALEARGWHGVLHIRARPDRPYLNETVLSRTRAEILAATGSRYAPASPADGLGLVERAPGPCVMIGKPCDVAAAELAGRESPALAERLGLTVAIFCAGTPSLRGTMALLARMGVRDLRALRELRYRGMGWPGRARARLARPDGGEEARELSYEESWGETLTRFRPWRCHVCADHSGEFADVSVGDPWYREVPDEAEGHSLLVARTPRGREAVLAAERDGHLVLESSDPSLLPRSQPQLLRGRGAVWGRVLTSRLMGAAAPRYRGLRMFRYWWGNLSVREKARTIVGTARRVLRRGLLRRRAVVPFEPVDVNPEA